LIYYHICLRSLSKKRAAGGEKSIGVEVSFFGEIKKPTGNPAGFLVFYLLLCLIFKYEL